MAKKSRKIVRKIVKKKKPAKKPLPSKKRDDHPHLERLKKKATGIVTHLRKVGNDMQSMARLHEIKNRIQLLNKKYRLN
jgi:hypothetical protein